MFGWIVAASLGWLGYVGWAVYHFWMVESVHDWVGPEPDEWPSVSLIVPACNEADRLGPAMQSILSLEYPDLEIILIEDRSTDETPALADRLAADDERMEVVHIEELPEGWLGKVHALHKGVERASGDWFLFTDADILYDSDFLQTAIRAALHREVDHVSLVPQMRATGFWHEALVATFTTGYVGSMPRATDGDESDDAVGIGAFNLVRRSALERTEGLEWLRMEIADDSGLGLLINRHGGSSLFGLAGDGLALDVYDSFTDFIAGMDKNGFAIMAGFSWLRVVFGAAICLAVVSGPFVGIAWTALGAWPFAAVAIGSLGVLAAVGAYTLGRSPWPFLGAPVAQLALVFGMVRSAVLCTTHGEIEWRGTSYPLDELRRMQRISL